MEREKSKQEFLAKFGEPLDSLDLRKPITLWYPSYFIVVRLVFVVSTLMLWSNPLGLLAIRVVTALFSFVIIAVLRPYEKAK